MPQLPKSQDLLKPILKVLNEKGTMANDQIRESIASELSLTPEDLKLIHSGTRTEFEYRLAWARTKAKNLGLITSPKRMHWQLTDKGKTKL